MPFSFNPLLGVGLDKSIPLDGAGKIPSTFLPSYVDDVEEYSNLAAFPATGETGKIYVAINTGFVYRWSGSVYVQIGITAAAGSTTQVQFNDGGAFGGDAGLVFDKTTDALTIAGPVVHPLGAAATPSLTFTGDPNTGIFSPGADQVAISTNGTGRLFVNASGNVGLGSSAPNATLTVLGGPLVDSSFFPSGNLISSFASDVGDAELITFGNASLNASTFTMAFVPRRGGSTGAQHGWYQKIDSTSAAAGSYTLGTLQRAAGGGAPETPRFHITSGGLVGIGTTSPSYPLHVRLDQAASTSVAVQNTSSGSGAYTQFRVDGDAGQGYFGYAGSGSGGTGLYEADYVYLASESNASGLNLGASSGPLRFFSQNSERGRFDASGRLLVGTSTSVNVGTIVGTTQQIAGSGQPLSLRRFSNSTVGPNILFGKTRATTDATYTIVENGDTLGGLIFAGSDGVDLETPGASIVAEVDGTPGANDMPGRLVFSTTSDGAATTTERLRITSAGVLQVADAGNIAVGTTTGTKIGTATTQKLGFYNATPVVQPTAVADATDAATVITQLNALLAKLRTLGIIAT